VLVALAVTVALAATSCTPTPTLADLDRKVYATSLASFDRWWRGEQAAANHVPRATVDRWLAQAPARLDSAAARSRPWDVSTDLCSFAADTGPVFDFRSPCVRHDFAWRNLRRLDQRAGGGVATRARRLEASRQFLRDMDATCAARPFGQRTACRGIARTYFAAVAAVS
jgi:hypothetical protein